MHDPSCAHPPVLSFPSEEFLRDLVECVTDGVIAADMQGRFVLFNSSAQRILGLGPRDVPSSEWSEMYGCFEEDATTPFPPEQLPLARALRGESVSNCIIHIRNPQVPGGVWISVTGSPLRDSDGTQYGGVVVVRDVTQERSEFERVRLLSAVAEQTADAVVVTDRNGIVEYVNPAVEKMTGFAPSELLGRTPSVLKSGLHTEADYAALWDTLLKGEVFRGTLINRKKGDGEIYFSEQTITPIQDAAGRISRFVSVGKDLTEVRRALDLSSKLRLAREVQQKMYPLAPPDSCGFEVAGTVIQADETGGDYYDFVRLPDGGLALAVGDVSGHGFDSALHMVQTRSVLRTVTSMSCDPATVLAQMNQFLCGELADNRFITLVLACIHADSRTLRYASAGHTSGYLISAAGELKAELASTGIPLGLFSSAAYESITTPRLDGGDLLALVTDGITESGENESPFGPHRVLDHLIRHRHLPAGDLAHHLCNASRSYAQGRQEDDMTAVICKVGRCDSAREAVG